MDGVGETIKFIIEEVAWFANVYFTNTLSKFMTVIYSSTEVNYTFVDGHKGQ